MPFPHLLQKTLRSVLSFMFLTWHVIKKHVRACLYYIYTYSWFLYLFDITFCSRNRTCLLLPVRHFLCTRNMYLSPNTCVQETCSCPPLPAFNKLVYVPHYLCSIKLFGPPLPAFNKLEHVRYHLCSINLNFYVSTILFMENICTCPSYLTIPVYNNVSVSDNTCEQ